MRSMCAKAGVVVVMVKAFVLVTVASLATPASAEMMLPRDPSNAYQQNPHAGLRHVLLYDRAKAHGQGRAALRASLARLSRQYGFRLDTSAAPIGYIQPSVLEGVDVLVLAHGDENVLGPEGSSSTAAVERFVYEQGKGLLMVHAAGAFLTCHVSRYAHIVGAEPSLTTTCGFLARAAVRQYHQHVPAGSAARIYVDSVAEGEIPPHESLGGTVPTPPPSAYAHGIRNPETRNVFTGLPRVAEDLKDEWWRFRSSPWLFGDSVYTVATLERDYVEGRVNVLLSLDERSLDWGTSRMGDHPVAWTRKMGNGLVAFNSAGHDATHDVYTQGDSLMERFNGRLLRYLARDFVGCMDPASARYNPDASVVTLTATDPANPCTSSSVRFGSHAAGDVSLRGHGGVIRLSWTRAGRRDVRITDVAGGTVASLTVSDEQRDASVGSLKTGVYVIHVRDTDGARYSRRLVMK